MTPQHQEPEGEPASRSTAWWTRGKEPDYRASLANERTLLAWSRTPLAFLAAAFAVVHLTDVTPRALRLAMAGYLVALAGGVTIAGYAQWRSRQARMREGRPLGRIVGPAVLMSALLVLSGFVIAVIITAS
ncbi:YidH family protein [Actinacidiphila sp. bgisy144]|uniref:YidH family protein n=1 Tax=Actinacidiphila sp. bgisy144 TaxID=3413791 RepID=UPI003EB9CB56